MKRLNSVLAAAAVCTGLAYAPVAGAAELTPRAKVTVTPGRVEVTAVAEKVVRQVRSMGVALTPCTVPHSGEPSFELGDDEIELGIGIHGEPGRERRPLASARELAAMLVEPLLADEALVLIDEASWPVVQKAILGYVDEFRPRGGR